ncbi:PhnD/SsuA/transferrin family substrate-binding protein [Derxia gummosa]|uniref:PhnD/SsuA/transferrin family substrate-binding protein n=1 Tax=Derxia gummosa DSM 723 TaxID=1121388 RepID=A0A8B6X9C2_9BURK|nr:PhnD/SsuA/transferrin family substrate-binding protein [Derxia gummosa]
MGRATEAKRAAPAAPKAAAPAAGGAPASPARRRLAHALGGAGLLGLGAGGLLAGCGRSAAPQFDGVTLRLGDQQGMTRLLADAADALAGLPYQVEWITFPSPPPLFEAFRGGHVDFTYTNDILALVAATNGLALRLVAASAGEVGGIGIVVPAGSPIRSVADLRGRDVIVSTVRGGIADWLLQGALAEAGVDPREVNVSYALQNDALTAFQTGRVQAWATNDPQLFIAQQSGGRLLRDGTGINSGRGIFVASVEALGQAGKRAAIADLLGRLARAREWANSHLDEFALAYVKRVRFEPEVARAMVGRGRVTLGPLDDSVVAELAALDRKLVERGVVAKAIDVNAIVERGVFGG